MKRLIRTLVNFKVLWICNRWNLNKDVNSKRLDRGVNDVVRWEIFKARIN